MSGESQHPFEGVSDFFSEMARMREMATGRHDYEHSPEPRERTPATAWVPAADIFARGDDLVIRVELAGMRPDDVTVSFARSTVTIHGSRHTEEDTDGPASFYIRERFHGAFRRAVTVPADVEGDQITAEFFDGLVEIVVAGALRGREGQRIELRNRTPRKPVRRRVAQQGKSRRQV